MSTGHNGQASSTSGFVWAETKRACCMCKREKVRCEGGRPCLACMKKGLRPEQCVDGCRSCRQARLICDGRQPCSNCQEAKRECVQDMKDVVASRAPAFTFGEPIMDPRWASGAQPAERTKIACLACRRDNKRCENAHPCARCLMRNEECVSLEKVQTIVKKRCQACRRNNRKCEDQRPCPHCVEETIECIDIERRGTGPGSRVKKACTHCKRLKVQCDDERPCKNCVRRKLDCDGPADLSPTDSQPDGLIARDHLAAFDLPDGDLRGHEQAGRTHEGELAVPLGFSRPVMYAGMQPFLFPSQELVPPENVAGPSSQVQMPAVRRGFSSSTSMSYAEIPFRSSFVGVGVGDGSQMYGAGGQTNEQQRLGDVRCTMIPVALPPNPRMPMATYQFVDGSLPEWSSASSSSGGNIPPPQGYYSQFYDSPADGYRKDS